MTARVQPINAEHPGAVDPRIFQPWLTVVGSTAGEHAVLSDGLRHIRIDVEQGSLCGDHPVLVEFLISGMASADAKVMSLRRFLDLRRQGRFRNSLYPLDKRASQREIAVALFGETAGRPNDRQSDSLRSRVRRLAAEARRLAGGGYRALFRR